jgi:hypothetical protein
MKLKDFFTKRATQAKINDEAFTKFLETAPDAEIPDEIDTLLESHFMTAERAQSDKAVMSKARYEVYTAVDERLRPIISEVAKIDPSIAVEADEEKDTLRRLTKLAPALTKAYDKAKTTNVQETEKIKEYEKQQKELLEKITTINKEREEEKTSLSQKFESEKKSILLEHAVRGKINSIEFAEEHKPLRGAIEKLLMTELMGTNHLSVDERGQIVVSELENGVPKPKFNGNTQVTFDSVLEEKAAPYIKRNNAGGEGQKQQQQQRQTPPNQQPNSGQRPTLKEMQAAANAG